MERHNGKKLRYCYEKDGLCGFRYYTGKSWQSFSYVKNPQGDIILIKDESGVPVVKYHYDIWGNVSYEMVVLAGTTVSELSREIATANPFRYRGYYYDEESKLYYLLTRYYDPYEGIFISPDSFDYFDPSTIGGVNLYAYCNYNPIMYSDPTGESIIVSLLVAIAIGAIIGGTIGGISAAKDGKSFWGGVLSGALVGGVLGAVTILGGATALAIGGKTVGGFIVASTFAGKGLLLATSVGITALTSFGAGVGSYAIEKSFNNQQFDWNEALLSGTNTAIKGLGAFVSGMALASGGAYNFLLKGAATRTISKMIIGGIFNGIVANGVKMLYMPWYYAF